MEGPTWGVTEQIVEQEHESRQGNVVIWSHKRPGATGVNGFYRFVNTLNRKARFQCSDYIFLLFFSSNFQSSLIPGVPVLGA